MPNRLDGIGWFTYETLKRITQGHPECQFYFLFDRAYDEQFIFADNIEPIVVHPQARHPFLFYLWFEQSIPRVLKKLQVDLFLSQDGYLSLKSPIKQLAVIHDINFHHYPQDLPFLVRKYYNYFFPKFAHKASRIATVSEFSKQDIVEAYGVAPDKIDVVYNGVNERYAPVATQDQENIKKKYTQGKDFFLFIGTLLPRKNIVHLLKGFERYKQNNTSDTQLLMVGNKKWWTADMEEAYQGMQYKDEVIFPGYIGPKELHHLLGAATGLSFVPYFEGFGIPIIEAMKCGTPVITSDASSTKEVGADAAILVDPYNVNQIAQAMQEVQNDQALRQRLIQKGLQRANDFSWEQTAEKLWACVERVG